MKNLPNISLNLMVALIPYIAIIYFIAKLTNKIPVSLMDWLLLFFSYGYSVMATWTVCTINAGKLSNYPKNKNLTQAERMRYEELGTSGDLHIFVIVLLLTVPIVGACYYLQSFDYISVGFASLAVSTITGLIYLRKQ